jgi:hypothetical protein
MSEAYFNPPVGIRHTPPSLDQDPNGEVVPISRTQVRSAKIPTSPWSLCGSRPSITKIAPEAALAVAASTSLRGLWGDLDVVPHGSQPVCQIDGGAVMVQLIEVTRSEFAVVGSAGEHVVGRH